MPDTIKMSEATRTGCRWHCPTSLALLIVAILLGTPAVGSYEFSEFMPFILTVAVGFGVALSGLRNGTLWNRVGSGASALLLLAVSACMAIAVRFQEPP